MLIPIHKACEFAKKLGKASNCSDAHLALALLVDSEDDIQKH